MRALVIGYFCTVGDIEVLRQVERRLNAASIPYDVGAFSRELSKHIAGWVDIYHAEPRDYTHLCVVCGPFNRAFLAKVGFDLDRFSHCTRIGVNLTMLEDLDVYNPLDALVGRDNSRWALPDISLLEEVAKVPVAGICLVRKQREYGDRQRHDQANDLLRRLAERAGLATIELDTEWPAFANTSGLSSAEQYEFLCARLDVMLTTRLHGTVLSLKNGVPVLAVDPISGGDKVSRQAKALGWAEIFRVDDTTDEALDEALARCLHPSARDRAVSCAAAARQVLARFPSDFAQALKALPRGVPSDTAAVVRPQSSTAAQS